MSFKKLGIALAAMAALGAVLASSAFAGTPVTEPAAWVTGSEEIASENIECSIKEGSEPFVLRSKVLGAAVELTATGLNCAGAKIETVGTGSEKMAVANGQIEFTGVSVMLPSGCKTPETNKTNALVADLQMDATNSSEGYVKFEPAAGSGASFTNVKLEGCAAAGTYPVKGVVYGDAANPTEVQTEVQEVAGNETTHAMSTLKLGNEAATLTGDFGVKLESGNAWGAKHP